MEPITTAASKIDQQALHDFQKKLTGDLLLPDDKGYDETRKVWNGMIDKHPALIVRCHQVYVNLLGVEGEERVKEAYGKSYSRLVTLKNKYDPNNLFRLNQNIKPVKV